MIAFPQGIAAVAVAALRAVPVLLLCTATLGHAHQSSDSYLVVDAVADATLAVRWDISLRDLDRALNLDRDNDGQVSWAEVSSRASEIDAYAQGHLRMRVDGRNCTLQAWRHRAGEHSDGRYLITDFHTDCAAAGRRLRVAYDLFFALDPMHRGLLRLLGHAGTRTAVLGPDRAQREFELSQPAWSAQLFEYGVHGVWHIWQGLDHILFLLSLLLPSVLLRKQGRWQAAPRLRGSLLDILRVVTAFTVAHSITLSLAALGVLALPSRLVESTIAASVVLAALNNLRPLVGEGRWLLAFGFGLIHGFGFASVLADLGLPRETLVGALVGFNLGVEAGQLALVLAFVPLVWSWRASRLYRIGVLGAGSAGVAVLAAIWLVERAGNLSILPFKV